MKQTIFNASLEESMNLVTDKYIQTAMEDINEKGYWRKIIGGFTMILFLFMGYGIGFATDHFGASFFFQKVSIINLLLLIVGTVEIFHYFIVLTGLKDRRVLSYYYYNRTMFIVMFCFVLQGIFLIIGGAGQYLGSLFSSLFFSSVYILILLRCYQWFKTSTLEALYGQKEFQNPLVRFLEYFVVFAKKYGGIIAFLLILLRWLFPNNAQHNDFFKIIGSLILPLIFVIPIYFMIALGADNFQGYYIKKYMEEYRELSGYTVEEWYGPRSKKAKESK
ncbi:hypothetical protein [Streptococcus intermedius]|jgi:hypothetical protein|uniref:hypothetical protein n=2 Tax=Streptococcus intermedius TaxID=1338 RepID=UPI00025B74A5|nr:hypothetical protein [Streptococcus intermedius]EID82584.1 hypothetical protein HMPREF1109_1092 [Streptococcus intermedius SK54 = ATCC 27335]EPH04680.1 hypothetical protein HMPREF1654_00819 [Streptococcus intermedius SK54 = ATCC 27335]RSJ25040.1 hypothetical protein D8825_09450 [Streptococcus intermedius]SQH51305.1 Uncharacterised protein [Streptococcus intermedius]BAM22910.1 hypothetical protein SCIM_0256 [Streptococcus intermedius JTH08]